MSSTVATECPSEHISALQPLSYQLVMTSLRLIAEVLTLVANSFSWGQQTDKLAFQAPAEPESCLFLNSPPVSVLGLGQDLFPLLFPAGSPATEEFRLSEDDD
jgi:hypothetical protein